MATGCSARYLRAPGRLAVTATARQLGRLDSNSPKPTPVLRPEGDILTQVPPPPKRPKNGLRRWFVRYRVSQGLRRRVQPAPRGSYPFRAVARYAQSQAYQTAGFKILNAAAVAVQKHQWFAFPLIHVMYSDAAYLDKLSGRRIIPLCLSGQPRIHQSRNREQSN